MLIRMMFFEKMSVAAKIALPSVLLCERRGLHCSSYEVETDENSVGIRCCVERENEGEISERNEFTRSKSEIDSVHCQCTVEIRRFPIFVFLRESGDGLSILSTIRSDWASRLVREGFLRVVSVFAFKRLFSGVALRQERKTLGFRASAQVKWCRRCAIRESKRVDWSSSKYPIDLKVDCVIEKKRVGEEVTLSCQLAEHNLTRQLPWQVPFEQHLIDLLLSLVNVAKLDCEQKVRFLVCQWCAAELLTGDFVSNEAAQRSRRQFQSCPDRTQNTLFHLARGASDWLRHRLELFGSLVRWSKSPLPSDYLVKVWTLKIKMFFGWSFSYASYSNTLTFDLKGKMNLCRWRINHWTDKKKYHKMKMNLRLNCCELSCILFNMWRWIWMGQCLSQKNNVGFLDQRDRLSIDWADNVNVVWRRCLTKALLSSTFFFHDDLCSTKRNHFTRTFTTKTDWTNSLSLLSEERWGFSTRVVFKSIDEKWNNWEKEICVDLCPETVQRDEATQKGWRSARLLGSRATLLTTTCTDCSSNGPFNWIQSSPICKLSSRYEWTSSKRKMTNNKSWKKPMMKEKMAIV